MASPTLVTAQSQTNDAVVAQETTIKAAYLYSFGRYVKWPKGTFKSESTPFVIAVVGDHPIIPSLEAIAKRKRIGGRRIVVRRIASVDQVSGVQILFIPGNLAINRQFQFATELKNRNVLLVGETIGLLKRGGTINFFMQAESIRMRINVDSAKRQGLIIDAKLLNLATLIKDN